MSRVFDTAALDLCARKTLAHRAARAIAWQVETVKLDCRDPSKLYYAVVVRYPRQQGGTTLEQFKSHPVVFG